MAAEKIKAQLERLSPHINIPMFDIKDTPLSNIANYDIVLLGISTWDFGELQEDWESHWSDIGAIDFT
ncbi:MAG: flavodoxin domain-containing protein, partial [Glaciecola sp.]